MELKVWVEGIQRVVCGITEQTTVQEVVIALAQATGRTGRYTLVEKWRDMEKLLPPSEHPIKVLEKWGEYAGEVQFLLKRTGASSTNSDTENTKAPERNQYRQSLPPLAKNREKSELLQALKRKEPKRKSVTGSVPAYYGEDSRENKSQNSNGNNNKVALLPPDRAVASGVPRVSVPEHTKQRSKDGADTGANVRKAADKFREKVANGEARGVPEKSVSSSSGKGKEKSKSKCKADKKTKEESRSKKALLPPGIQKNEASSGKGNISSATKALFPSESKSDVEAKSPTRKVSDNPIKNLNTQKKVPLMPPSNKILRNRNQSSSVEKAEPQSPKDPYSPSHTRNLSSGSLTPSPFSLPNENKLTNYAYRYGNSLPRSKKKSWSEAPSASVDDKYLAQDGKKKSALMPPVRKRAVTPNPTSTREAFHPALRDSYHPASPVPTQHKSSEQTKAREDFVRLVSEQQKHIEEQVETVSALDKEIQILLEKMQQREKTTNDEIVELEEKNRRLKVQMQNEEALNAELSLEDSKGVNTRKEMDHLQAEIDQSQESLASYKRKIDDLTKIIADETYLQRVKQKKQAEEKRNQALKSKKDIERLNWDLSSTENEIRRIEKENAITEEDIGEKYGELENLNRELRQVNLQQFIRQTGSKVTVLPPNTDDLQGDNSAHKHYQSNPSLNISGSRSPLPPPPSGSSEGVWV